MDDYSRAKALNAKGRHELPKMEIFNSKKLRRRCWEPYDINCSDSSTSDEVANVDDDSQIMSK